MWTNRSQRAPRRGPRPGYSVLLRVLASLGIMIVLPFCCLGMVAVMGNFGGLGFLADPMKWRKSVAITSTSVVVAPIPDRQALQGKWNQVNDPQTWQFEFVGDRLIERARDGSGNPKTRSSVYQLNSDVSPREITWGDGTAGICKLEGNRLTLCFGVVRPKIFKEDEQQGSSLYVFQQVR